MILRHASTYLYHANVHRKLAFSLISLCFAALLLAVAGVFAQEKPEVTSAPFDPAAYRVGERLTYNVSFAQFVSAGHIELFVAGRGRYFDRDGIQLQAHVETSGDDNPLPLLRAKLEAWRLQHPCPVKSNTTPSSAHDAGCGCHAAGADASDASAFLIGGFLIVAWRRKRATHQLRPIQTP